MLTHPQQVLELGQVDVSLSLSLSHTQAAAPQYCLYWTLACRNASTSWEMNGLLVAPIKPPHMGEAPPPVPLGPDLMALVASLTSLHVLIMAGRPCDGTCMQAPIVPVSLPSHLPTCRNHGSSSSSSAVVCLQV